jgi:hypothetical protein
VCQGGSRPPAHAGGPGAAWRMRLGHTVGRAIPGRVARQQSPRPFHPAAGQERQGACVTRPGKGERVVQPPGGGSRERRAAADGKAREGGKAAPGGPGRTVRCVTVRVHQLRNGCCPLTPVVVETPGKPRPSSGAANSRPCRSESTTSASAETPGGNAPKPPNSGPFHSRTKSSNCSSNSQLPSSSFPPSSGGKNYVCPAGEPAA